MTMTFTIGNFDANDVREAQARRERSMIAKIDSYIAHEKRGKEERHLAKEASTAAIQLLFWYQRELLDSAEISQRIEDGTTRVMRRVMTAGTRQDVTPLDYFTTKKTPRIGRQFSEHHRAHFDYLTAFECWVSHTEIVEALTTQPSRQGDGLETVPAEKQPRTLGDCELALLRYVRGRHHFDSRRDGAPYDESLRRYVRASLENMSGTARPLPWGQPMTEVTW
jgi:hypothetical protein